MTQSDSGPVYGQLPVFEDHHGRPESWGGLHVTGMVENPRVFNAKELRQLSRHGLTDDFQCVEGWSVPDLKWQGVALSALLDIVKPLPEARFAAIAAADFCVGVELKDPAGVLLATSLNGDALTEEHGGPCRLVSAGQACYSSVKWVDSITLTEVAPEETARAIAIARNAGR